MQVAGRGTHAFACGDALRGGGRGPAAVQRRAGGAAALLPESVGRDVHYEILLVLDVDGHVGGGVGGRERPHAAEHTDRALQLQHLLVQNLPLV